MAKTLLGAVVVSFFLIAVQAYEYSPSPSPSPSLEDDKIAEVNVFVETALSGAIIKTQEFLQNVIEKRVANTTQDGPSCLGDCKMLYEQAINNMNDATDYAKEGDYSGANNPVTGVAYQHHKA